MRRGAFVLLCLVACADPVHNSAVKADGPEKPGVPEGEYHRAGEACDDCHGDQGPASTHFVVAGTVFASPNDLIGVYDAEVQMTDSVGTQFIAKTNCVGNFFVQASDWNPKFPILVRVHKGAAVVQMQTQIGRQASCGYCHKLSFGYDEERQFVPHIQLFGGDEPESDASAPEAGCPVTPILEAGPGDGGVE